MVTGSTLATRRGQRCLFATRYHDARRAVVSELALFEDPTALERPKMVTEPNPVWTWGILDLFSRFETVNLPSASCATPATSRGSTRALTIRGQEVDPRCTIGAATPRSVIC